MLIHAKAEDYLKTLQPNLIDCCLTDPPYHYFSMDSHWSPSDLNYVTKHQTVKSLPGGMKLDPKKGKEFQEWYYGIAKEIYRVLKPGAFFFSFSAPRLYHRATCAIEDAGFLIRDCFIWLYTQSQPKAMSVNHFLKKGEEIAKNWKTPQVKSCFEPISVAQKPPEGTLAGNFKKYGVGLFNTDVKLGKNMFPANCIGDESINEDIDRFFLVKKPTKKEKGEYNKHRTVKPVALLSYMIQLATQSNALILDPFIGSGSTCVAAVQLERHYIGIDINEEYLDIAKKRLLVYNEGGNDL